MYQAWYIKLKSLVVLSYLIDCVRKSTGPMAACRNILWGLSKRLSLLGQSARQFFPDDRPKLREMDPYRATNATRSYRQSEKMDGKYDTEAFSTYAATSGGGERWNSRDFLTLGNFIMLRSFTMFTFGFRVWPRAVSFQSLN